jgi:PhzF family phenazine biosynthesis protein
VSRQAFLYASFAAAAFGGNVAGVVFLDASEDDEWMQGIAADLSVPTTGFVDLASAGGGDARVRFFTPRMEIEACGHVTVAVATALVEEDLWQLGSDQEWSVSASGGRVPLLFEAASEDGPVSVTMQQRLTHFEVCQHADVSAILGRAKLDRSLPIVISGTGLRHLLVAVASPNDLAALTVERDPITRLSSEHGVDTIGAYAREEHASACATSAPASGRSRSRQAGRPRARWLSRSTSSRLSPSRPCSTSRWASRWVGRAGSASASKASAAI